jgi:hypothetical protein
MDPYLESPAEWPGMHSLVIAHAMSELNRHLPDGYRAKIDEYVYVRDAGAEEDEREMLGTLDAFIPEGRPSRNGHHGTTAVLESPVTEPTTRGRVPVAKKRKRNRAVQIVTDGGRRVLSVIEVLSPSNKSGDDRDAYLLKRRGYLGTVNLVEIDLLRAGNRMPVGRPAPPPSDYLVFAVPLTDFPQSMAWAFTVRDELPVVPVHFAPDRPPVSLNLRAVLDRVYDESRFEVDADYTVPPVPALRPADAEWAAGLFAKPKKARKGGK